MTEGDKTISERIYTVECINWTLLKSYDKLTKRISLQEGNMNAMKFLPKNETSFSTGQTSNFGIFNEGIRKEQWTGDPDITKSSGKNIRKDWGIYQI